MAGDSDYYAVADRLGYPKAIFLFALLALAITAPSFVARTGVFSKLDPAWFCLVVGAVVSLVSYALLVMIMKKDFDHSSLTSTVVVLGLVSAHVCVFDISDKLPHVPVYLLFGFVFYYHFTALEMFKKHKSGGAE